MLGHEREPRHSFDLDLPVQYLAVYADGDLAAASALRTTLDNQVPVVEQMFGHLCALTQRMHVCC